MTLTSKTAHTPGPWRMHDMEAATIVAGKPGGEVANCCNGFGDQDANARFIIAACNSHAELLAALEEISLHCRDEGAAKCAADAIAKARSK